MATNGQPGNDPGSDGDGGDDREARVLAAVRAYETELQAGRRPNRRELLARHPDIADDLAACLGGLTFARAAAAGMGIGP